MFNDNCTDSHNFAPVEPYTEFVFVDRIMNLNTAAMCCFLLFDCIFSFYSHGSNDVYFDQNNLLQKALFIHNKTNTVFMVL